MDQQSESPTFQNENIRFTVHHKPKCIVEFAVEALEPLVQAAHKDAIRRISKEVMLPGFRRGKAPDTLVLKNYPKEIDKEWQQAIADQSFAECQKLSTIVLLRHEGSKVSYQVKDHSSTGALLTLLAEVEPTPPEIDPAKMTLKPVKRPVVDEGKIEETIRQTLMFFANWQPVEDRPIQVGDFVTLDVDIVEEHPPTPLFSDTRFEVSEKSMAKWMYDLVLGKTPGDTVEGISVPDADASEEDKENLKPKKVEITILSVATATLPELDDAFAKNLGASSVEDLRTKVTDLLNKQADAHVQEAEREQVANFLLDENPFDLPQTLVDKEVRFRFEHIAKDPEFSTYWGQLSAEQRKNTAQTLFEQSEKAVRLFYLCRHILSTQSISITADDVPPAAHSPLEWLINPQKLFHHQRTPEIEHAEAYSRLVLEKAEDYILKHAPREEGV